MAPDQTDILVFTDESGDDQELLGDREDTMNQKQMKDHQETSSEDNSSGSN